MTCNPSCGLFRPLLGFPRGDQVRYFPETIRQPSGHGGRDAKRMVNLAIIDSLYFSFFELPEACEQVIVTKIVQLPNSQIIKMQAADCIFYIKGWPFQISVWRKPVGGGEEVKILDSVDPYGGWTVGQEGIYFFTPPDKQGHRDIRLYELPTSRIRKILTIERPISDRIAVAPDDRTILYTQFDEVAAS